MLKRHLLTSRGRAPGGLEIGETACGRKLFKSTRTQAARDEWEAAERIGGAVAATARDFEPDRDACKKCAKAWAEGAGL